MAAEVAAGVNAALAGTGSREDANDVGAEDGGMVAVHHLGRGRAGVGGDNLSVRRP